MSGTWVFGYGSLVSPESFGATLRRPLVLGVDLVPATLTGFERRWNYGALGWEGSWRDDQGQERVCSIVALGLVRLAGGSVNGVIARLDDHELERMDRRERSYDRVVVTDYVSTAADLDGLPVITYVPRPEAVAHYESARDRGVAAIERRYWDLVHEAFAALGPGQLDRYRSTTPAPDVPIRVVHR